MTEEMTPEEQKEHYQSLMQQVHLLASFAIRIDRDELKVMLSEAQRYDTVGPIIDPTAWRNNQKAVSQNRNLIKAVLDFQRKAKDVLGEIRVQQDPDAASAPVLREDGRDEGEVPSPK